MKTRMNRSLTGRRAYKMLKDQKMGHFDAFRLVSNNVYRNPTVRFTNTKARKLFGRRR
jgi:hypothetical protein